MSQECEGSEASQQCVVQALTLSVRCERKRTSHKKDTPMLTDICFFSIESSSKLRCTQAVDFVLRIFPARFPTNVVHNMFGGG